MYNLRISPIQASIVWENTEQNLQHFHEIIKPLANKTDLVIFPEMFTTGFSMASHDLAESNSGSTISKVQRWAAGYNFAIAGSFIATENEKYYNRAFLVCPTGEIFFRDKRHLFSPGEEEQYFSAGNNNTIIPYKGWNIRLLICYDLRFPVWSRNVNNECDLLIYTANWPSSRQSVWKILLPARAIENQCYVCGVNRVGEDGAGVQHSGNSLLVDAKGRILSDYPENVEHADTIIISKTELDDFRSHFPVWKDADNFNFLLPLCREKKNFP